MGAEEEFHLVDPRTGLLAPAGPSVVAATRQQLAESDAEQIQTELQQSMVESGTPVCTRLAELGTHLVRLRRTTADAAADRGLVLVSAGVAPVPDTGDAEVTPHPRYRRMAELYGHTAGAQLICGFQTQVGVPDPEAAVSVVDRIRPWLPALLALSASSPLWAGRDTGFASYRTQVWDRWPTAGVTQTFGSAAAYADCVETLVASGVITDPGMIYFDVRPSARYPTVEVRICDAAATAAEAVMLAGLCRALVWTCLREHARAEPRPDLRIETLRAARWQAARFGLGGDLLDPHSARPVPARTVLQSLLAYVEDGLAAAGDRDVVRNQVAATLDSGGSAARQRAALVRGGLPAVLAHSVAETAEATLPG